MIAGLGNDVVITARTPALAWIVLVVMAEFEDLIITSMGDGVHAANSAHYRGEALDVRSHDLPAGPARRARAEHIRQAIGPGFTILVEPDEVPGSTAAPHIHIQLAIGRRFTSADLAAAVDQRWNRPPQPAAPPAARKA